LFRPRSRSNLKAYVFVFGDNIIDLVLLFQETSSAKRGPSLKLVVSTVEIFSQRLNTHQIDCLYDSGSMG
jgi:hypothetical protein